MTVVKRMRHKKEDGSIVEADIGALAKNVEEDATHRFVSDDDKKSWDEKPSKDGDVAETKVSSLEESKASFPEPAAGDKQKTLWGKIKKWQQDCLAKFGNYVLMSMITNQHLNSTSNVPTSALVYLMQQAISKNQGDISVLNTKLQNFLKYQEINITADKDSFATIKLNISSRYMLPVLANPGTRNWEITVGLQYTTSTLCLTGPGVKAGYVYTVRIFYFMVK